MDGTQIAVKQYEAAAGRALYSYEQVIVSIFTCNSRMHHTS